MPFSAVWADRNVDLLVESAKKGDLAKVKSLVEHGVDVNAMTFDRIGYGGSYINVEQFALAQAAAFGHLEVVKYLIDKGADMNVKDEDGETALMWASKYGHFEVVKALVEGKKGGLLSIFRKGVDINATDNSGLTALNKAKTREISDFLESKGAKRMQLQYEYK